MTIRTFEGHRPRLGPEVYVDATALVIGDVEIGADASVWPMSVVRGDVNAIRIGARSNIQDGCVLHVSHDGPQRPGGAALHIGEEVTVGHKVVLHGCTVGEGCLIGMGAIVLDGAQIGAETLIGAGTLVTADTVVGSGELWLGSPARRVRLLSEAERSGLRYSARHYVQLQRRHRQTFPVQGEGAQLV